MKKTLWVIIAVLSISCNSEQKTTSEKAPSELSPQQQSEYIQKATKIAQATGKVLVGKLTGALESGGLENAITYCKHEAYPITDSLSQLHHVAIKRTSHKIRNEENNPTDWEKEMLVAFVSGKANQPQITSIGNTEIAVGLPIITMGLCTSCHGEKGSTLHTEAEVALKEHYPNDKATGFKINELRGMWSIVFNTDTE